MHTAAVIRRETVTATLDGEFVVFLIGMRINRPLMVHRWLPVVKAGSLQPATDGEASAAGRLEANRGEPHE